MVTTGEQSVEKAQSRASELRSVANSIEPLYPSAADLLRGIAREMDGPPHLSTPPGERTPGGVA